MITKVGTESPQKRFIKIRWFCACPARGISERNESHIVLRKYQTEAAAARGHEVVILTSGAWRTYVQSGRLHDKLLMGL